MALYTYEIGTGFVGTGTAQTTAASKAIAGTATSFDTEFAAGDLVTVAGETRVVDSVTDAATMAATANFTTGSGGGAVKFTGASMTNVEDLTNAPAAPKGTMRDYAQYLYLGNQATRGAGWPVAEWHWDYLTGDQRDDLKAYCSAASAEVFIRTRKNTGAFGYYEGVMIWPQEEEKIQGYRLDFTLTFQSLEEISTS